MYKEFLKNNNKKQELSLSLSLFTVTVTVHCHCHCHCGQPVTVTVTHVPSHVLFVPSTILKILKTQTTLGRASSFQHSSKLAPSFPLSPHPIRSNLILWYFLPPQLPQWAGPFQTKILSIVRGSINGKTWVGQQLIGRPQIEPSRCICRIWSVVRRGQGKHSLGIGREVMKMTGPRHRNRSCNICDTIHGIHVVQWFVGSMWGWLTAIVPCLKSSLQHGVSSIPQCIGKGDQVQTIKQSLSHRFKPMAFVCTGLTYCRAHFNKQIVGKGKITKKIKNKKQFHSGQWSVF